TTSDLQQTLAESDQVADAKENHVSITVKRKQETIVINEATNHQMQDMTLEAFNQSLAVSSEASATLISTSPEMNAISTSFGLDKTLSEPLVLGQVSYKQQEVSIVNKHQKDTIAINEATNHQMQDMTLEAFEVDQSLAMVTNTSIPATQNSFTGNAA